MLLLFKLSHFDATKGEWLKAEGELNSVYICFRSPPSLCDTSPQRVEELLLLLFKLSHFDVTKGEWP